LKVAGLRVTRRQKDVSRLLREKRRTQADKVKPDRKKFRRGRAGPPTRRGS